MRLYILVTGRSRGIRRRRWRRRKGRLGFGLFSRNSDAYVADLWSSPKPATPKPVEDKKGD